MVHAEVSLTAALFVFLGFWWQAIPMEEGRGQNSSMKICQGGQTLLQKIVTSE